MNTDNIKEIKIDDSGRLCVTPESKTFEFIYRSATEVHWDNENFFLYSPKPREWSYLNWYQQIVGAIKSEYGVDLLVTKDTLWTNIPISLKEQILAI